MSMMASQQALKQAKKSKSKLISPICPSKSYITVDFQYKFQKYCLEYGCQVVPNVEVEGDLKDNAVAGVPVLVICYKTPDGEHIEKVYYKNSEIETGTVMALENALEDYMYISVLKLEFCNMTSPQIEILSNVVSHIPSITELSVNGNPNKEQNFHLLLRNPNLIILSLKYCSIDKVGMEKISEELSKSFEGTLLHLNLASNLLFDEGMEYVARFLRINRTLISLNLADNKIYDEGCVILLQPLQKFPLKLGEIIVRRQIRFDFFKKSFEVASLHSDDAECSVTDTAEITGKTISTKSVKNVAKDKSTLISKESLSSSKRSSIKQPPPEMEYHPFVQESYPENLEIYCKGNNTLLNLNLSYNRITQEGLNPIIQMLRYQRGAFANDKGISRISLEGNDVNTYLAEQELNEIDDLIARRSRRSSSISSKNKSQASFRKRTSMASRGSIA